MYTSCDSHKYTNTYITQIYKYIHHISVNYTAAHQDSMLEEDVGPIFKSKDPALDTFIDEAVDDWFEVKQRMPSRSHPGVSRPRKGKSEPVPVCDILLGKQRLEDHRKMMEEQAEYDSGDIDESDDEITSRADEDADLCASV